MSARLRTGIRALLGVLAAVLMRVLPVRNAVLVCAGLDDEDNAFVAAAYLADGAAGPVVLSCADPELVTSRLATVGAVLGRDVASVRVVRRFSGAELVAFSRSALVLYTHGMYNSPRPVGRRVHVNLWHGSGPKWIDHGQSTQHMGSHLLVASAHTWGRETARALRMPADTRLLTGNPRQHLLRHPPDRHVLTQLGLDPDRPLVVWMPTFRATALAAQSDRQGESVAGALTDEPLLRYLLGYAQEHGVQVAVKTHPYDADDWDSLPVRRLTSDDLWDANLSIYRFLALAGGLVSDYSSVWVDYLDLDRPVGLFCPDLHAYVADRGLNEPSMDVAAAELFLADDDAVRAFVDDVRDGRSRTPMHDVIRGRLEYPVVDDRPAALRDELLELLRTRTGSARR